MCVCVCAYVCVCVFQPVVNDHRSFAVLYLRLEDESNEVNNVGSSCREVGVRPLFVLELLQETSLTVVLRVVEEGGREGGRRRREGREWREWRKGDTSYTWRGGGGQ